LVTLIVIHVATCGACKTGTRCAIEATRRTWQAARPREIREIGAGSYAIAKIGKLSGSG